MYFLIQNGQIAGTSDAAIEVAGLEIVEGIDLPVDQLYWDRSAIQQRPERPSPLHYWQDNQWILPNIVASSVIASAPTANWEGLIAALRGTPIWAKTFSAAGRTVKANAAWTLLYGTLTATRNLEDLQFAIAEMRGAMRGVSAIGDFTPEELATLNQLLQDHGFSFTLQE